MRNKNNFPRPIPPEDDPGYTALSKDYRPVDITAGVISAVNFIGCVIDVIGLWITNEWIFIPLGILNLIASTLCYNVIRRGQ